MVVQKLSEKTLGLFDAKVVPEPNTGCWLWAGCYDVYGYGRMRVNGEQRKVHRIAYERHFGVPPAGLCVCHRCDTRACVNPAHLFVGTPAENSLDMWEKGRAAQGESNGNAKLTAKDVRQLRFLRAEGWLFAELGREFGISTSQAHVVASNGCWGAIKKDDEDE